ncbi:MAG TPA: tetratricopeptide repeat protein [Gemmatimonadaceae bacterium]
MISCVRCVRLSCVVVFTLLAAAPLRSQTSSGTRTSHPAAGGASAQSIAEVRAIMAKLQRGEFPTPQEAMRMKELVQATGSMSAPSPQLLDAMSPLFDGAPNDIQRTVRSVRAGHKATPAEAAKLKAFVTQAFLGKAMALPSGLMNGLMASAAGNRVASAAEAMGSAVCPASRSTSPALSTSPPTASQLSSTLNRIIQRSARAETPTARAKLATVIAGTSSPAHVAQLGAVLWMYGASNGGAYALASAAKRSSDPNTLTNLGAALNSTGDYADAATVLRAALAKDPALVPALNNLAVAMANLGDLRGAERTLRQVLQTAPRFSDARFSLGRVLECEGDMAHALAAMRQATEEQPSHARQQFMMAVWRTTNIPMVDAASNTDPGASNAATGTTNDAPHATRQTRIDGALSIILLPGTVAGYTTLLVKRHAFNDAAAHDVEQTKRYTREKSEYEAMLAHLPGRTTVHRGGTEIIPISDEGIKEALDQAWDDAYAQEQAVEERNEPVFEDIDHAMEVTSNRAFDVIGQGGHPCSVLMPALTTQYGKFLGVHNSTVTALNTIAKDYAARASRLIDRLHDPIIAAIEEANVRLNLLVLQSYIDQEATTFGPNTMIVLQTCPASADVRAVRKPQMQDVAHPGPCHTLLEGKAIILSIKIDCRSVTLSGGEGLLGALKYDIHTHAGTIFLGGGLNVEGPGLSIGGKETGVAGVGPKSASLSGKIGISLAFDGSGNFTDAGFTTGVEAGLAGKSVDITQTVWAINGMQYSPDAASIMR